MSEWVVPFNKQKAIQALEESFLRGPVIDDTGLLEITEAEVGRLGSLKIEIYSREHPPPHFRVSHQGQTADYQISDCEQIKGGLRKFYRNVRQWHVENKQLLIDTWNSRRPTDCPVGYFRA